MEKYPNNSFRAKEEANKQEKKVEQVVTNPVKQQKKSGLRKFKNTFVSEDSATVRSYVIWDIIVPAVTNLIEDVIVDGTHMILRGEASRGRKDGRRTPTPYNSIHSGGSRRDRDREWDRGGSRLRTGYDYEEYSMETRGEAEEVLSQLEDLIATYGTASVADFYDLIGVRGNYTDNKYGWKNLRNADVERVRGGYVIRFPKALPLN